MGSQTTTWAKTTGVLDHYLHDAANALAIHIFLSWEKNHPEKRVCPGPPRTADCHVKTSPPPNRIIWPYLLGIHHVRVG